MEFTTFVRKPFVVEAVEVTKDNIKEIAELVGTLKEQNGEPYISVNRELFPNIFQVHPGFWMTKMGDNIRCYSKQVFENQFMKSNYDIEVLVRVLITHADGNKSNG